MYIFNPEHDLCLDNGDIHYVPPESALAFGRDCADIVKFMHGLDSDADNMKKIVPWGWNKVLRNRLLDLGYDKRLLPSDVQLQNIAELSHRRIALQAHEFLCRNIAGIESYNNLGNIFVSPEYRVAAESLDDVENFLVKYNDIVLKAPLSGSGKGIRFVSHELSHSDRGWCRNLIKKHYCVIAEQRFSPVLESAMLFRVGDGVKFLGYSLFYSQNGAYKGNILASNEFIERRIEKYLPDGILESVKNGLIDFLKYSVAGRYEGFVGVDQFVCKRLESENTDAEYLFVPVVEINMRMTMGLLARNIYDNFGCEYNLSDNSHCFEIAKEQGTKKLQYKIYRC